VLLTVATVVEAETQGFVVAGVPEPESDVVDPTQAVNVPLIVGKGLRVIVVEDTATQPFAAVAVRVYVVVCVGETVKVPGAVAVNAGSLGLVVQTVVPPPVPGIVNEIVTLL